MLINEVSAIGSWKIIVIKKSPTDTNSVKKVGISLFRAPLKTYTDNLNYNELAIYYKEYLAKVRKQYNKF